MGYNYIEYSLENYIDTLYDVEMKDNSKLLDIISKVTTMNISDKWKSVFEDITIFYICSIIPKVDISKDLTEIGYSYMIKYCTEIRDNKKQLKREEYHMEIKKYIFSKLTPIMMDVMIDKYIDTCFSNLLIELPTYDIREPSKISTLILNLFSNINDTSDLNTMLYELIQDKIIRIVGMYIKLVNGLYNQSTFQTILSQKIIKLSNIYKSTPHLKSYKLFSSIWKTNSDFQIHYNYLNLSSTKQPIPFYPVNELTQNTKPLPISINNIYEVNLRTYPIDYILYRKNDNSISLITLDDISDIYNEYIGKIYLNQINNFYKYNLQNNLKSIIFFTPKYTTNIQKNIKEIYFKLNYINENNFEKLAKQYILQLLKTKIDIHKVEYIQKYVCIHESLIESLEMTKSVNEYKIIVNKIAKIIPDKVCKVCDEIVKLDINDSDYVMVDELELMDEYFRLSDFIRMSRTVIEKLGRIFDVQILKIINENQDHKNFLIQNLLIIINSFKTNEDKCTNILRKFISSSSDDLFFIFTITNGLYIQEYAIDKYIYTKLFNIYIVLIILILINYSIDVKIDFNMFNDLFKPIYNNLILELNIKPNDKILSLLIYITVYILKYKLIYIQELKDKMRLIDRIRKYGPQIFTCLIKYIYLIIKISDDLSIIQLTKQKQRLVDVMLNFRGAADQTLITYKYTKMLKNWNYDYIHPKRYRFNMILYQKYNPEMYHRIKYNCKIFCKDGIPHQLQKKVNIHDLKCTRCNEVIDKCNYKIQSMKYTWLKLDQKDNTKNKKILSSFKLLKENTILKIDNIKNIFLQILANINENNKQLYKRIWLRRDILKIQFDGIKIYMNTTSTLITLYWFGARLLNLDFPEIKISISMTRLGKLFFNKIKTKFEFYKDMIDIAIASVTSNIEEGKRTKSKKIINDIQNTFDMFNKIDISLIEYESIVPIISDKYNKSKCVLENDYISFTKILIYLYSVLSDDIKFINSFNKKLNEYIDKIDDINEIIIYKNI